MSGVPPYAIDRTPGGAKPNFHYSQHNQNAQQINASMKKSYANGFGTFSDESQMQ